MKTLVLEITLQEKDFGDDKSKRHHRSILLALTTFNGLMNLSIEYSQQQKIH